MDETSYKYLKSRVESATPIGLIILLYDGLLRFANEAQEAFSQEHTPANLTKAANAIDRCIKILTELNNSLNHTQDAELCNRLSTLYQFFLSELSRARVEHDPKIIKELEPLIEGLRTTWEQAEEKAAGTSASSE